MIWIKDYIEQEGHQKWVYKFYESLSGDSLWFNEKFWSMIPEIYEERRQATMLEF